MLRTFVVCCLFLAPVWSDNPCDPWETFCVDDGNVLWSATANGIDQADLFFPSLVEASLNSGSNTVVLSTTTRSYQVKVTKVILEVQHITEVTIAGDTQAIPVSERNQWKQLSFDLDEQTNSLTLDIDGDNPQAKIRSVFISGCVDGNAKEINDRLDEFKAKWENGEPVADFIDEFYTPGAVFIEQGQPIRTGTADIVAFIFGPVQAVRPSVDIDVFQAIKLSEVRMFTMHFATFYDAGGIADPVRRYFLLWKRDDIDGDWFVDRASTNYEVAP